MAPSLSDAELPEAARIAGIPARLIPGLAAGSLNLKTDSIARLRAALEAGRTIIVVAGSVGVGKTVAAARHAFHELRCMRDVFWLPAWRLSRISAYDDELLTKIETVPTLILDDLGSEYLDGKGFLLTLLQGLLYQRYDAGLITIATCNLQAEAFSERYGERLTDRIREVGEFIESGGESLRSLPATAQLR